MSADTGIYVCTGCKIGKAIDAPALCEKLEGELKPAFIKDHQALCSAAGSAMIGKGISDGAAAKYLIVGCGAGTRDEAFDFEAKPIMERVNIRELVAWSLEPGEEDTQMAAEDYIRMGFAGLSQTKAVTPYILDNISEQILVLGGGVAGMSAALKGAAAGYNIQLVEKGDALGGWTSRWTKQIPFNEPFDKLRDTGVNEMVARLEKEPNVTVRLQTEIEKIDGQPGEFKVALKNGKTENLTVGAIVTATGWEPYKPKEGPFYGYGTVDGIYTSVEFEERIKKSDGKGGDLLFIQCAGSRDKDHLPYCSTICCGISLKQARLYRELHPDAVIYVIYKDMRTLGFMEEFYSEMQKDPGIVFIKGEVKEVELTGPRLGIEIKNELLGEDVRVVTDQIVLATGMVPSSSESLKLGYRLGEGLPELKYDFPDSHFICFPYETRRTGIYAAGAMRAPMDIPSAMDDAGGAMMKAIQTIESAKRGDAVHPRAGDQSYPELYLERCTDCKRCTEECPFGTYDETESGTPIVHPNRCRRCGICMGACPERVISFADYSVNIMAEKIKAVEVPDEFEEKPRVLVFVCENDALPALYMAVRKGLKISPYARIIPVRCLGSINRVWVSDALSKGYDGILQIGCKPGDNYQCHFIHGSELTEQRSEIYEETLSSMMLEPERIETKFVEITDYEGIINHINEYMEEVDLMGPNPFKDL